jgi:hypothetical protein
MCDKCMVGIVETLSKSVLIHIIAQWKKYIFSALLYLGYNLTNLIQNAFKIGSFFISAVVRCALCAL